MATPLYKQHLSYKPVKAWQGHTLLELLIALSLGALIMYAIFSLHQAQHTSLKQGYIQIRQTEAGLTALHLISTHLHLAGYRPTRSNPQSASLFGCTSGRPVGPMGLTHCKPDPILHSDGLEITYMADRDTTWTNVQDQPTDCLGQALLSDPSRPEAELQKKPNPFTGISSTQRFFVQQSPSTGKTELYCEGSGRPGIAQPIIEGVEQLRVRYRLSKAQEFVDAGKLTAQQWPHVATIELCVVIRDTIQHAKAKGPSYIDCNGQRRASQDGYLRAAFSTWVAIHNRR